MRVKEALDEFEASLGLARDALDVAIDRAIPVDFFLAYDAYGAEDAPGNADIPHVAEDDSGFPDILHVIADAEAHRGSLREAQEIINDAFHEFDWQVNRALLILKRALTEAATS